GSFRKWWVIMNEPFRAQGTFWTLGAGEVSEMSLACNRQKNSLSFNICGDFYERFSILAQKRFARTRDISDRRMPHGGYVRPWPKAGCGIVSQSQKRIRTVPHPHPRSPSMTPSHQQESA